MSSQCGTVKPPAQGDGSRVMWHCKTCGCEFKVARTTQVATCPNRWCGAVIRLAAFQPKRVTPQEVTG